MLDSFYIETYGMAWKNPGCIESRGFGTLFLKRLNKQHMRKVSGIRIEQPSCLEKLNILQVSSYAESEYLHCINDPTDGTYFTTVFSWNAHDMILKETSSQQSAGKEVNCCLLMYMMCVNIALPTSLLWLCTYSFHANK